MAIKIIRVKNDQSGRAILNKLIKEGATSEIQARAKASIEKLNDAFSFGSKVLESDKPSLVLYTAEWCGPCKLVEPIFDDLAKEYDGKININIVDVDVNTETPTKYNIRGIPSIAIFKDGVDVGTKVGALSKDQIKSFIKENTNIN
ncbi:MAG: thioredoxin fold domain-containing protein [Colwellia sp.]|nr:thioredoxin fold domain-containing protein [Colwellia sp.]